MYTIYSGVDYFSDVPMFQNMVINKSATRLQISVTISYCILRKPHCIFISARLLLLKCGSETLITYANETDQIRQKCDDENVPAKDFILALCGNSFILYAYMWTLCPS